MTQKPGGDFGRKRQSSVYIGGMSGKLPSLPVDVQKLEQQAGAKRTWCQTPC